MTVHDVRQYGALGDGEHSDTAAIQAAIDAAAAGGGVVALSPGRYVSGTLELRSGITLKLHAGATLLGARASADYPEKLATFRDAVGATRGRALVCAVNATDVAIEGPGTIDGRGEGWQNPRPMLLRFVDCTRVRVTDVTLRDSAAWVQHYLGCADLQLRGVNVFSRVNSNNDGLNLDGCQRVRISDCHFSSGDDALTLKCTSTRPCRDVVITNCLLSSDCNALKFGTESLAGGFETITMSNIAIYETRLAGITIATVDGARLRDVIISNVTMRDVGVALFMRLGSRGYHLPAEAAERPVGCLDNVILRSIQARTTDPIGSAILGLPGHPVRNVLIDGLTIEAPGGGTSADLARVPEELPAQYPQYDQWGGRFPAYGLYCRHVQGVKVINSRFDLVASDGRHAIVCHESEDVQMGSRR